MDLKLTSRDYVGLLNIPRIYGSQIIAVLENKTIGNKALNEVSVVETLRVPVQISCLPRSKNSPMIGNESAQTIFMKSFSQNRQRKFPKMPNVSSVMRNKE